MSELKLLAFDIGASNGRAMLARFDGARMTLSELHRFDNSFVEESGVHRWDAQGLFSQLRQGFSACKRESGAGPDCFGIDTWGVDFGLLGKDGRLIENPRCYRDATDEEMRAAWEIAPKREIFERTGIAAMNFNTIYQLVRQVRAGDAALNQAQTLLLMPDLLGYFLTGERRSEYTNVTTTNLYHVVDQDWDFGLMERLGIPTSIFTPIDRAGTLRGRLLPAIASELGIAQTPFAAVGTHDTASAVAAIPGEGNFAFCSSGTWSLFGMETGRPMIDDIVFGANFSNEGSVQGGCRPLKNIMGLWLMQECRREWTAEGRKYHWDDLCDMASASKPFVSIIDPDDAPFFSAGDMRNKIVRYCARTGQQAPQTPGEFTRCIFESLALKYRWALEQLERMKGTPIDTLNLCGGGIANTILCQMTADATGKPVVAGPAEGSALGNALMQAIALGEIKDIEEGRAVVRRSIEPRCYQPNHTQQWEDAYERLLGYMEMKSV